MKRKNHPTGERTPPDHLHHPPSHRIRWQLRALAGLLLLAWGMWSCRGGQLRDDDDWETRAQRLASPQEQALQGQAMTQIGQGKPAAEAEIWHRLLRQFPKGYYGGRAHTRLGLLAYRKKQWQQAIEHFQATATHRLSSQERKHILLYHARALWQSGRDKGIQTLLHQRYKELKPGRQRKALQLLIQAAERRKRPKLVFHWRMKLLTQFQGQGQGQEGLRQSLIAHVNTLGFAQLHPLMQHVHTQPLRFPIDYMAMRYAQMLYQKERYPQAKKLLQRLLSQLSTTHPLRRPSTSLLAEVSEIKRPADPRVIGVIIPQSGPGVQIGMIMRSAIDLAIQQLPKVRLVYMNSGGVPSMAAEAVETLVRKHKAIAIFGPPMPRTAWAAAKRAQKLGVPLISITAREKFADIGKFIFRNNLSLSMMGRAVAQYGYHDLRIRRFGVLYPASKYGRFQAQGFLNELRKLGAKLTSAIEYDPNTSDFQMYVKLLLGTTYANSHVLQLNRSHMRGLQAYQKRRLRKKVAKMLQPLVPFEGLFIPEQAKIAAQIAAYLAYYNVGLKPPPFSQMQSFYSPQTHFRRIQLLGNNNWLDPSLFQAGNKYVRGGVFCVRFYPGSFRRTTQNFVQQYQGIHGKPPPHISAFAYDSMLLLATIASSGKVRTRPRFQRALMATRDFDAATGPLRVLPNGEVTGPIHFLIADKGTFRHHGSLK